MQVGAPAAARHRAGELEPRRKELLDAPDAGMVWEPGEEAWEENKLATLRPYRRVHGHLAPRQDAVWDGTDGKPVAIGQLMANLRRKSGDSAAQSGWVSVAAAA